MRTISLSLLTRASLLPSLPTTVAQSQALASFSNASVPMATAATPSPLTPDQDFGMGSLPWPPLWVTVFAFALTLLATVTGVGVWLISSPPSYGGCDDECEDECEGEAGGGMKEEGKEWWEGKGEQAGEEGGWDSDDEDDDDAVELKRLLGDAPRPPSSPTRQQLSKLATNTVKKCNIKKLRLDLSAAAGLGVGSWGRGVADHDGIDGDGDVVWEPKCRDYGVEGEPADADDETSSLLSLSLASCSSSSPASRLPSIAMPDRGITSTSTKPVFNQPLRGWRKAVDDRVGELACWIEAYVADGGREGALLCKVTREERGDVLYGFEY